MSLSGMTSVACFVKLISRTLLNTLPSNCQSDSQASSWYMSSTDLRAPVKANLLRNSTVSWKRLLCHHMKTFMLDSQNCWTDNFNTVLSDFDFIQHVSTPTYIQGHILVLCTSKSLTSSVHHYVKDSISDHLAVFFTTTFPVKNSCRVKV